ncbi:protein MIS12 homolog [Anoplophora glabripennis]|uniref:protein MIS12 homolog n=1 Tax=Anoplophora glabripennis TaxID=217634 RepID=UPI00087528B9|nr:protein MIS12 homolog [Anoplophora glabripennis]
MMDDERLTADEYEKQYYGFSSTELYQDFEEQVCIAMKQALTEMENALKEQHIDEGSQKIEQIYTIYVETARVSLQKFKEETKKIFAIPKNVILDEDKHNTDQYSEQDITQLEKEVIDLQNELLTEKVFLERCKRQKEIINTSVKPLYEKVNGVIKYLKTVLENVEADKNRKIFDIYEHCIQYYFNNEDRESELSETLNLEQYFLKESDDFFNMCK